MWDRVAGASAELGVIFTGLTLLLGSLWGRPVWGVWWAWDARLVTTAVLFFLYLGYLALRRVPAAPDVRAKRCAIAALIAFVDVPIVHFSVTWWRTLHQEATVFNPELDAKIHGTMAARALGRRARVHPALRVPARRCGTASRPSKRTATRASSKPRSPTACAARAPRETVGVAS